MNFGRLNNRTSRSGEPPETFGKGEFPDGTGVGPASTNAFERPDMIFKLPEVKLIAEDAKTRLINFRHALQKLFSRTIKDYTHVKELLPFNVRYHANDSVFK